MEQPQVVDLDQAELALIAAARRGAAMPSELAGKLATIMYAAVRGQPVTFTRRAGDAGAAVDESTAMSPAAQAVHLVAGEAQARAYLERVSGGTARPDELLHLLGELEGHERKGAARAIEKALEARHG